MTAPILLDISRTVARARLPAPTGIDRVERAHIDWALGRGARFLARIGRRIYLPDPAGVAELVGWLDGTLPAPAPGLAARLRPGRGDRLNRAQALIRRMSPPGFDDAGIARAVGAAMPYGGVYLNVGHDNLSAPLMTALAAAGLARLVLIHDTIPLDFPQFARRGTPAVFREKLQAAAMAEGILCNSEATRAVLAHHMTPARVWTAPLGVATTTPAEPTASDQPYFLCLGTIEPRKNHALLLDVWTRMGAGPGAPHLRIAGRRGWENRTVFRRLNTDPMIGRTVHELGTPGDAELAALIAGARALVIPSFAEGYGLPLAEALAAGVPVIASDLAALREVGGDVPEWLPPDAPEAWLASIRAYSGTPSPKREAQLERLRRWRPPNWADHFHIVGNAIETISSEFGTEH